MSWEAIVWARSVHVADGPVARNVLHQLAIYANPSGDAWPSQEKLCELTQYSIRAVRNALKALEAEGFVVRTRQVRANGSRTVDCFHLVGWPPTNLSQILEADAAEQASWGPAPGPAPGAGPHGAEPAAAPGAGSGPACGAEKAARGAGPESRIKQPTPAPVGAPASAHARGPEPARDSLPEMGPDDPGWPFVLGTARDAKIPDEAIRSVFEGFRSHRMRSRWASAEWMPAWRRWCLHPARVPELALWERMKAKAAAITAEPLVVNGGGGLTPGPRPGGRPAHGPAAIAHKLKTPEMAETIARKLREYHDDGGEHFHNVFGSGDNNSGSTADDGVGLGSAPGGDDEGASGRAPDGRGTASLLRTFEPLSHARRAMRDLRRSRPPGPGSGR